MKKRVLILLLGFTLVSTFVGNTVYASSVKSAVTHDQMAVFDNVTSLEEYCRVAYANGFITKEAYESSMRKLGIDVTGGTSVSSPSISTPKPTPVAPKCEHEYTSAVTTPATCADEGVMTYTCSKCGNTYTENIPVDVKAHAYEEVVTKEATCTEDGEITYTCSVCGDAYTETVKAIGHDYISAVTKVPTCTEIGEKTFACAHCGDTYTEEIDALGHDDGEWIVTSEPSIFTKGVKELRCTRCGEVIETAEVDSILPIWVLYTGIGVIVAGIAIAVVLIVRKKRK